jgi:ubiquinone/menaquinone biosynthesis C-methylase UbiE
VTMITTKNVAASFDEVAPRYDLMVALNPGYHTHLRAAADVLIERLPHPEATNGHHPVGLLDLGCGSGASTRAILQAAQAAGLRYNLVGVDASTGMVDQARAKQWPDGVRFELGLAEESAWSRTLWGIEGPIHGVLAAYLFRNVSDRDGALAGLFDLIAADGVLVVQEYSTAESGLWGQLVWSAVCWLAIIPLGLLISRRTRLYRYLWRSVLRFDSIQTFVDRLYRAGFTDVEVRTVPGWQRGILHTFRARKPAPHSSGANGQVHNHNVV